jgi:hypothetical protein
MLRVHRVVVGSARLGKLAGFIRLPLGPAFGRSPEQVRLVKQRQPLALRVDEPHQPATLRMKHSRAPLSVRRVKIYCHNHSGLEMT